MRTEKRTLESCRPFLALGILLLVAGSARATTFPVTKTADTADGACDADCSLREAIIAANANAGPDVITLPAGTYNLAIAPTGESIVANNAAVGDLDIAGELTINGAGASTTIVDGQDLSRIFHIHAGPVAINNLTARNGTEEAGGGIFIAAVTTVNLSNIVVTLNNGLGSGGGGIRNAGGTTTISDSTISANVGTAQGAGIFTLGTPLTIVRSTISGNSTTESGGGIRIDSGTLTVENSTISGNTANSGGGIRNLNGTVTVTSSTIANNSAGTSFGGGIATFAPGVVTLTGSIVANNTAGTSPDCTEAVISGGFNLIEDTTGCAISGTTTGNITGQDPQLLGLAGNGGPTQTHALNGSSPALNARTSGCPPPSTDQRGVTRPQGTACEIGSFECQVVKGVAECAGGVGATPTPTATATPTVPGPTATPTPPAPTATATAVPPTATFTPVTGAPAPSVPTLTFPMLALLGFALAGIAVAFLMRRP
jgi:CSLREA domain-containing protein